MEAREEHSQLDALRQVAEKSPDAVIIADTEGKTVVFANMAASTLLNVNTNDDIDKIEALLKSVDLADQDYLKNKYRLLAHHSGISGVEFRLNSDGNARWLSCEAVSLNNDGLIYVVARDITKTKEHENYLVEFAARKNTLLDTLIHQLSGALSLMNNLALKADKLKTSSDKQGLESVISLIYNNSSYCIKIIDDLVRKEHSESPGIYVKFSRVDLVTQVSYIFDELKKNDGTRRLLFETTSPVIFVDTDDLKLLQVINNLVSNSLKFTRQNDEIKIRLTEMDSTVVISVSDTGIGIPKSLQPFLFEKHGPARRTGLSGEKSVGLGLSICRNLINLLGGQIRFESEEGKGTTFILELPKD